MNRLLGHSVVERPTAAIDNANRDPLWYECARCGRRIPADYPASDVGEFIGRD